MLQFGKHKPTKIQLVILLAVAVLCFGLGSSYGRYQQKSEQAAVAVLAQLAPEEEERAITFDLPLVEEIVQIAVHIKGAVQWPGIYLMDEGSRVADALDKAGLLADANTDIINLALLLEDGMQVVVPYRVEDEETDWQALAESSGTANSGGSANALATAKVSGPININSAGLNQLQTLEGIGPAKAQAIIDYRDQHGAFTRIEDIKKVSGIGSATFEKIKEHICVE